MSDPSAMNIPLHQALTSDMLLGLKPSAPKSRSYRLSVPPINQSVFTPGAQMIFECPTGRKGSWLDQSQSYLKFSVQCTSTAAANPQGTGVYLDNSAYSFIQRLDVYNSSNLLETINEYGQLANFLIDTSLTMSDKAGLSSMIGTNPTPLSSNTIAPIINTTTRMLNERGDRSGQSLATVIAGAINTAIPYTFSLPILSGIVGVNASKMLPVGQLFNPIRLEFYLAANDDAIYYGTAAAGAVWQLVNVELVLCYVEIQDDNLNMLSSPDETEYISTTTYRQASTYMPAATAGDFTTLLPFRAASITALYARFRPFGSAVQGVNASAAYRKGASINPNLGSYYFRVGSSIYPNKPVYLINGSITGTGAEGYAELLKSFHALSSSIGNSAIPFDQYNVCAGNPTGGPPATGTGPIQGWNVNFLPTAKITAANTGATAQDTHANAFAIGLELQSFSNRNDTILSGVSTLNSQIYFTGSIYTGQTAGGFNAYNYTIDFFSQMDMILCIQNGIMSAKF